MILHTPVPTLLDEYTRKHVGKAHLKILKQLREKLAAQKIKNWWAHTKTQQTDTLNQQYSHMLICGEDDWTEIPFSHRFRICEPLDEWWSAPALLSHITQQLNHADMNGPVITYPCSPFTRRPYDPVTLHRLKSKCKQLGLEIHPSVQFLLKSNRKSKFMLNKIFTKLVKYGDNEFNSREIMRSLRAWFEESLRYRLLNRKDSQNNYLGVWVPKKSSKTSFEVLFHFYDGIYPFVMNEDGYRTPNPIKAYMRTLLNDLKKEE